MSNNNIRILLAGRARLGPLWKKQPARKFWSGWENSETLLTEACFVPPLHRCNARGGGGGGGGEWGGVVEIIISTS